MELRLADEVIHFGRGIFDIENAIVERVDHETFSKGNPISIVDSPLNFPREEAVGRAEQRLGEKGYGLLGNNCEHFARWCRIGVADSPQIDRAETVARQATAVCANPLLRRIAGKMIGKKLGTMSALRSSQERR